MNHLEDGLKKRVKLMYVLKKIIGMVLTVSSFETPQELEDNYEPELDSLDTC